MARLRELCEELLEGAEAAPEASSSVYVSGPEGSHQLLGWDRRKLLRDTVLREMTRCRATQALAIEIKDRLDHPLGPAAT